MAAQVSAVCYQQLGECGIDTRHNCILGNGANKEEEIRRESTSIDCLQLSNLVGERREFVLVIERLRKSLSLAMKQTSLIYNAKAQDSNYIC